MKLLAPWRLEISRRRVVCAIAVLSTVAGCGCTGRRGEPVSQRRAEAPTKRAEAPTRPDDGSKASYPPNDDTDAELLGDFTLTLSCKTHGVRISTRVVDIQSSPPSIGVRRDDDPEQRAELEAADLGALRKLLASDSFTQLVEQKPRPRAPRQGPRNGVKACTLHVTSADLNVRGIQWKSIEELVPAAVEARDALLGETHRLERKLAADTPAP